MIIMFSPVGYFWAWSFWRRSSLKCFDDEELQRLGKSVEQEERLVLNGEAG